jgi:sterol carrier protein 2
MASPEVFDPLTRYQCCPPTCGAAAAVLCSEDFAKKHGITEPRLHRRAGHDDRLPSSFEEQR